MYLGQQAKACCNRQPGTGLTLFTVLRRANTNRFVYARPFATDLVYSSGWASL